MAFHQHGVLTDDAADAVSLGKPKGKPLNFDDLDLGSQGADYVPQGYGKLSWSSDFAAMNPSVFLKGQGLDDSGFFKGITSGDQIAWNNGADAVGIAAKGGFDIGTVEMTAAFDKKLVVDIYAFKDGKQVEHDTVTLTDAKPTLVKLGYSGVDEVDFVPGKETVDKKYGQIGPFIAFDDMGVSNVKGKAVPPAMAFNQAHLSAFGEQGHGPVSLHIPSAHFEVPHQAHMIA